MRPMTRGRAAMIFGQALFLTIGTASAVMGHQRYVEGSFNGSTMIGMFLSYLIVAVLNDAARQ